jgi:hypothetical protein
MVRNFAVYWFMKEVESWEKVRMGKYLISWQLVGTRGFGKFGRLLLHCYPTGEFPTLPHFAFREVEKMSIIHFHDEMCDFTWDLCGFGWD